MLELKDKTIYGKLTPKQEFNINGSGKQVVSYRGSGENSNRTSTGSLNIELPKTIAKPKNYLVYVKPDTAFRPSGSSSSYLYVLNFSSITNNLGSTNTGRYENYGFFMLTANTEGETTFTYSNGSREDASLVSGEYYVSLGFSDYIRKDIDNSSADFTVRFANVTGGADVNCADPLTDFNSFGAELSAGDYTILSSLTDELNKVNNSASVRPVYITRITNISEISDSTVIVPVFNIGARGEWNDNRANRSARVMCWNFETETWDNLNNVSYVSTDGGAGASVSNVYHAPNWYRKKDFQKYISGGTSYFSAELTSDNPSPIGGIVRHRGRLHFRYVGLLFIKGNIWT